MYYVHFKNAKIGTPYPTLDEALKHIETGLRVGATQTDYTIKEKFERQIYFEVKTVVTGDKK